MANEAVYIIAAVIILICVMVLCFLALLHYRRRQGHKGCVLEPG